MMEKLKIRSQGVKESRSQDNSLRSQGAKESRSQDNSLSILSLLSSFLFPLSSLLLLFLCSLFIGTVEIPARDVLAILMGDDTMPSSWCFIIVETRLPAALTAILCGSALAVSGLLLQTAFRNPLAGPGVFGISNGAALGVALVTLLPMGVGFFPLPSLLSPLQEGFSLLAAFAGALLVTLIIYIFSRLVRSNVMLLIVGIMVGYMSSALISLLSFVATEEGVRSYVIWGLGTFGRVTLPMMPLFAVLTLVGLLLAGLLLKPLNALLLGDRYAQSLGINIRRTRRHLLLVTGLLCAVATAYCGPIAFLGLAVPHMARLLLRSANHRHLLPATMLLGALVALACHLLSLLLSSHGALPVNAITPLVGAPVVVYVVVRQKL